VNVSRRSLYTRSRQIPRVKFAPCEQLTSFGGLVIFQQLFQRLNLWSRLDACCNHLPKTGRYAQGLVLRILMAHLLLGLRRLRERDFYSTDPLVLQTLGLRRMPSVPTLSRMLAAMDVKSTGELRRLNRDLVLQRLQQQNWRTITLDFDGSVLSTSRHAEGTAVGFNKQKKGARSYYPLFCHIAQSGQVFDVLARSGNVHDSSGAAQFVRECITRLRERLGRRVRLEVRLDSAFFSDALVTELEALGVTYSISVPFERFAALKARVETRKRWQVTGGRSGCHHFEERWKPQSWTRKRRFLFVSQEVAVQNKEPVQLDLFVPVKSGMEFKVILTNHRLSAGKVIRLHEGRGSQEKVFGEMKSQVQLGYIPCRKWQANQTWMLCALLTHNLGRELQMEHQAQPKALGMKRTARWVFEELGTLRRTVLQRAGKLSRPKGKWTLTLPDIPALKAAFGRFGFAFQ
jgi:hypothetical protein